VTDDVQDAGYEYVNIDDCWSVKTHRDPITSRLIPDPDRFPDGINGTAKKIHDLGLKIGIYSSAGTLVSSSSTRQTPRQVLYEENSNIYRLAPNTLPHSAMKALMLQRGRNGGLII
jgi:hypothetical protein